MNIDDARLDKLVEKIEEYRRRLISKNSKDVEYISTGNEKDKIKAPCCHIIEARRGCGKTTFIGNALSKESNVWTISIDCQKFNITSPDTVILQICDVILTELQGLFNVGEMKKYEQDYIVHTKGIKGRLRKFFHKFDYKIVTDYENNNNFKKSIKSFISTIEDVLNRPEEQIYNFSDSSDSSNYVREEHNENMNKDAMIEAGIGGAVATKELFSKIQAAGNYKRVFEDLREEKNESTQVRKVDSSYSKTVKRSELIDGFKIYFAELFQLINQEYGKRVVLFLDDFYQIEMMHQPRILQYLHGIYKESGGNFCFKAVAIPDSIKINYDGQNLFSRKDDFPTIALNFDLTNMEELASKLVTILISIDKNIGISEAEFNSLFTSGTLYYMVMASGGIPRDFMALFSNTLIQARKMGHNQIYKNDLYAKISELKKEKDEERDVDLRGFSSESIDDVLTKLEEWVANNKTNVMLYPLDCYKRHEALLKALINLRYFHIINEHVTPEGKNIDTVGILIDMTLYATSGRLPNYFKICEFWLKDRHSNELRRAKIYFFKDDYVASLVKG